MPGRPRLVVVTGPSGVGKGTLKRSLLEQPGLRESISATTRPPRPGERDGIDYHFMSKADFDSRLDRGEFLESAEFAGNCYGTLLSEVDDKGDGAEAVVLEIETLGAEQVRGKVPGAILIFIAPPSRSELRIRLEGRGTDSPEEIERRLAEADRELAMQERFDTVIVNDDIGRAAAELCEAVRVRLD